MDSIVGVGFEYLDEFENQVIFDGDKLNFIKGEGKKILIEKDKIYLGNENFESSLLGDTSVSFLEDFLNNFSKFLKSVTVFGQTQAAVSLTGPLAPLLPGFQKLSSDCIGINTEIQTMIAKIDTLKSTVNFIE